ncbi:MAG TPA: PIG-L family deacetylase [Acidimicrobiia bacterium]|nr:PIG-L family deacetylase [Acidimicrobiia bacterium]
MTITDATQLGTILGVFAHPDDEAYLAGGIMSAAVENGQRVVCVTATKGEAGVTDPARWDPARLGEIREQECKASMAILGVDEHHWLDFADGACAEVGLEEAMACLMPIVEEVRPDTVLSFGPEGMTGHPDHMATCRWATEAVARAGGGARLYYATMTHQWLEDFMDRMNPDRVMMVEGMQPPAVDPSDLAIHIRLEGEALDRKVAALRAQASQLEPLIEEWGLDFLRESQAQEMYVPAPSA